MNKEIKILLDEIENETEKEFRTKSDENGIIRFGNKRFNFTIFNGKIYCLEEPALSVEQEIAVMLKETIETFETDSRKYSSKENVKLAEKTAQLFHKESKELYRKNANMHPSNYSWW